MDTRLESLIADVDAAIQYFVENDETHWAEWFTQANDQMRRVDARGWDRLLSAFGGMGSVSDRCGPDWVRELLSRIWEHARELQREYDRL